jgi:hypothetical protein
MENKSGKLRIANQATVRRNRRLYAEFRVYFDPSTNQEMLQEVCNAAQDRIYDMFDEPVVHDVDDQPIPAAHDVTFEIVMEIGYQQSLDSKGLLPAQANSRLQRGVEHPAKIQTVKGDAFYDAYGYCTSCGADVANPCGCVMEDAEGSNGNEAKK